MTIERDFFNSKSSSAEQQRTEIHAPLCGDGSDRESARLLADAKEKEAKAQCVIAGYEASDAVDKWITVFALKYAAIRVLPRLAALYDPEPLSKGALVTGLVVTEVSMLVAEEVGKKAFTQIMGHYTEQRCLQRVRATFRSSE